MTSGSPSELPSQDLNLHHLRARVAELEQQLATLRLPGNAEAIREQHYRVLAEAMPQMVWAADAAGRHVYFNRRWYEYTGLNEAESLGFGFASALHPDDYARTLERWEQAWRGGDGYEIEYRFRRHDGAYQWFIGRATPVDAPAGTAVTWVGTCTDIHEQKRTVENLARTTRLLEERNRELDQFAYITSHDLKAPLRGIMNLSQWIEEDLGEYVTEETRGHLELLRGRARRMEALIDSILQFSRVGRVAGAAQTIHLAELLGEVVDLLAPEADVEIVIAPDMPTVRSERLPLQQVFQNLIGNAIKHRCGQPLRVEISAEDQGPHVRFAVADNGPGIAPRYHERIFAIFQTLAPRDRVEGSGLGLALVKKIVEHYGGQIWLASDEGQGATFFFTWPRQS